MNVQDIIAAKVQAAVYDSGVPMETALKLFDSLGEFGVRFALAGTEEEGREDMKELQRQDRIRREGK